MNNSAIFTKAHAMTKEIIKAGDSYQVTFGQCLKLIIAEEKSKVAVEVDLFMPILNAALFVFIMVIFVGFGSLVALVLDANGYPTAALSAVVFSVLSGIAVSCAIIEDY